MTEQQLQVADRPQAPRQTIECRVYPRQACNIRVSCQPTSAWGKKDARWPASITDVSQGGVRLIVSRRFEPGTGLGVELPGQGGDEPYTVLAKVVHVKALPDGAWALGCKFISELSDDEIQRLLPGQQSSSSLKDLAESGLGPISPSQSLGKTHTQEGSGKKAISQVLFQIETAPGIVRTCRVQRLSVPPSWPPALGAVLSMRHLIPQRPQTPLRLKVVHCSQDGDSWTVRCVLLDPAGAE